MTFKRLTDLDVAGKRVFIRADLNVPQDDNLAITDDTRIRAALPGIQYALSKEIVTTSIQDAFEITVLKQGGTFIHQYEKAL